MGRGWMMEILDKEEDQDFQVKYFQVHVPHFSEFHNNKTKMIEKSNLYINFCQISYPCQTQIPQRA